MLGYIYPNHAVPMLKLEYKKKAIELRIQGKTYNEIIKEIPNLSKSTLSGWIKNVRLTPEQEKRLSHNITQNLLSAKAKSSWTKKEKKKQKIEKIFKDASADYKIKRGNKLFMLGLALYWAEGNKKTPMFQFTNSDPAAIKLMIRWLTEIQKIPLEKIKIRLYIHSVYANENCEAYWSSITGIPIGWFQKTIFKPSDKKIKKNPDYKGCIQLRVLKSDFYWHTMGLMEVLKGDFLLS